MLRKIFLLLLFFAFNETMSGQNNNLGQRIGYSNDNLYFITVDTLKIKNYWQKLAPVADIHLTSMEIRKSKTFGEKEEDVYMLIAYDQSIKFKMCRYLVKKGNDFYYYKINLSENISDNEMFYCYYFYCSGTDDDCFPQVGFVDKRYFWSSSQVLICDPESPCKTGISFVPDEF